MPTDRKREMAGGRERDAHSTLIRNYFNQLCRECRRQPQKCVQQSCLISHAQSAQSVVVTEHVSIITTSGKQTFQIAFALKITKIRFSHRCSPKWQNVVSASVCVRVCVCVIGVYGRCVCVCVCLR